MSSAESATEISDDSDAGSAVALDPKSVAAFHSLRREVQRLTGEAFPKENPPTQSDLQDATAHLESRKKAAMAAKAAIKTKIVKGGAALSGWAASFAPLSTGSTSVVGFKPSKSSNWDSLDSLVSGTEKGEGTDSWGAVSVDPMRFKASLSSFIKSTPRQLCFVSGDPHDGHLGLFFIENATECGERSLDSWLEEVEEELKGGSNRNLLRSREMYELRSRVWETNRLLQSATFVQAALSGSDATLEVFGRRLFCLSEVLAGNMEWHVAELYLPAGSVKPQSFAIPAGKLMALGRNLRHANRTREAFKGSFSGKDKGKNEKSE